MTETHPASMVERVARAIYPNRGKRNYDDFTEAFYTDMEAQQLERARAAIEAMREPTEDVVEAGYDAAARAAEEYGRISWCSDIDRAYQAMIDEALK